MVLRLALKVKKSVDEWYEAGKPMPPPPFIIMEGIFAEMGYTVDPQQYAILVQAFHVNQNQIDDLSDDVLQVIYDIFNAGVELEEEVLHKYLSQVGAAIEEYNNDVYFDYDHNEEDEWKEMPPPPFSVMAGILAEYDV
jgi:hypothetical protein